LLQRLPDTMEFWHFGDTDPEGYEILRDLRERTGQAFRPLHMGYRPQPESPLLTSDDRRKAERLLNSPAMKAERSELEALLSAGRIGRFEQDSLGIHYQLGRSTQQSNRQAARARLAGVRYVRLGLEWRLYYFHWQGWIVVPKPKGQYTYPG
jgi:hypothetical protein